MVVGGKDEGPTLVVQRSGRRMRRVWCEALRLLPEAERSRSPALCGKALGGICTSYHKPRAAGVVEGRATQIHGLI